MKGSRSTDPNESLSKLRDLINVCQRNRKMNVAISECLIIKKL